MDKDFYTIKEFADKLSISSHTVRRCIKNGRLNAFRVGSTEKSPFRIPHSEISRMGIVDLQKLIQKMVKDEKEKIDKDKY